MDIARKTFRRLVDAHGTNAVGERCGLTADYIRAIYRGTRKCGRHVMVALRREFSGEFSADDDIDAEITAEDNAGADPTTEPGGH